MNPVDQRNRFEEEVFSYHAGKDGKVFINWHGKQAQKFISRVENLEDKDAQLVMAKITGNFKRGNERQSKYGKDQ